MLFVYWTVFNLLLPKSAVLASFQSGTSSSIGVLSNSSFPSEASENLPFNGTTAVKPNCGWIYAAAGSTSPGYFIVPNFGTFNLGSNNVGQSNVGYGNIGFGNYGQNNIGRLNNGNNNIGYLNDGYNNTGALNTGNNHIGDSNTGNQCIGYNNTECNSVIGTLTTLTTYSIGSELNGNFIFGSNSTGNGLIGQENQDQFNIGFQNQNSVSSGSIGVLNDGDGLVGYNNTGFNIIGQDNMGEAIIGILNDGDNQIGYNNTGILTSYNSINIGFEQSGSNDIGVSNSGNNLTGFDLVGNNLVGGTFIDTSSVPISEEILFDPQIISSSEENIGTNYNTQPANENRSGVNTPFIQTITAVWSVYLEFPAILSVTDLGCPGDLIQVFDSALNEIILVTSIPSPNPLATCVGLNDADESLADPIYSRGFVTLQPGSHYLSFTLVNGNSGTSLAFRFDYIKPPVICRECDAPVPLLHKFIDRPIIDDPPGFNLPEDIRMYMKNDSEIISDDKSVDKSSSTSTSTSDITSNITSNTTSTRNITRTDSQSDFKNFKSWCQSKRFQMLRDSFVSHSEASILCNEAADGLAKPNSPAGQLEITSLLFQCKPTTANITFPETFWIGSNWKGGQGHKRNDRRLLCLMVTGEKVVETKDCNSKRRFICDRLPVLPRN
jgi:hypothetical protein